MWHNRVVLLSASTFIFSLFPVPVATAEELFHRYALHYFLFDY